MRIMRSVWLLIVLSILIFTNAHAYDDPEGFRDLIWGQSINDVPFELNYREALTKEYYPSGNIKIYLRSSLEENYLIGGCQTWSIAYHFWQDRFYMVEAWSAGLDNFRALYKSATTKFGLPTKTILSNEFNQYIWRGTVAEILITYLNSEGNSILLIMKSMEIEKEIAVAKAIEDMKPGDTSGW